MHSSGVHSKGYTYRATLEDPQYEITSDKSDDIAAHKDVALRLVDGGKG